MLDTVDSLLANRVPLVTRRQVTRITGLTRRMVDKAIEAGRLDTRQLGDQTFITRQSVEALQSWINGRPS